jgi:hypothetical protein
LQQEQTMAEPRYPVAQSTGPQAAPAAVVLTPEETAAADLLYDELKPPATEAAREYVLARTPALFQEYMMTKIDADWPAPPAPPPELVRSRFEDAQSYQRRADAIVVSAVVADPQVGQPYAR